MLISPRASDVREAGFDYHIVKPADATELAKIVDELPVKA